MTPLTPPELPLAGWPAGFRREGLLRAYLEIKGQRRDCMMFSLLLRTSHSLNPDHCSAAIASISIRQPASWS